MTDLSGDSEQEVLVFIGTRTRDARKIAASLLENGVSCVWASEGSGRLEQVGIRGIVLFERGPGVDALATEQLTANPDAILISLAEGPTTVGDREVKYLKKAGLFMTVCLIEGIVFEGKRRARRFPCRIWAFLQSDDNSTKITVRDLSASGVMVIAPASAQSAFAQGDTLKFEIRERSFVPVSLTCNVVVRRMFNKRIWWRDRIGIGLEFSELNKEQSAACDQLMEYLLLKEQVGRLPGSVRY